MIGTATTIADIGFGDHMGDWGSGWWILMALLMVVFWGLVVVGIVWLVRSLTGSPKEASSAIELLEHRLASGEISPDEYSERRAILTGRTPDDKPR